MDYTEWLRSKHAEYQESVDPKCSVLEFIAESVFDLTTYDSAMAEVLGAEGMAVFEAITNKTTFDFIKDQDRYAQYLRTVNWPFFAERIDWGTSIRGAWWDYCPITVLGELIPQADWPQFCEALIAYHKSAAA